MRRFWPRCIGLSLVTIAACGGPQQARQLDMTPLGQARAIEVIEQAVASREVGTTQTNLGATLANGTTVNVDVWVPYINAGYVYINEQDSRDYGPIPERAEGSELHAVLATLDGQEEQVHLLILQENDYEYLLNPRAEERRAEEATIEYVESRLTRDSRDFIQAIIDLRGAMD